jgi:hypothetical protein
MKDEESEGFLLSFILHPYLPEGGGDYACKTDSDFLRVDLHFVRACQ